MQARVSQYMNEIISLTIMGLMIIALIAGQAGASPQPVASNQLAEASAQLTNENDLKFRHEGE